MTCLSYVGVLYEKFVSSITATDVSAATHFSLVDCWSRGRRAGSISIRRRWFLISCWSQSIRAHHVKQSSYNDPSKHEHHVPIHRARSSWAWHVLTASISASILRISQQIHQPSHCCLMVEELNTLTGVKVWHFERLFCLIVVISIRSAILQSRLLSLQLSL